MRARKKVLWPVVAALACLLVSGCSESVYENTDKASLRSDDSEVWIHNGPKGETLQIGLTSWRDLPFKTVKRQAYDYSCGSAAVATLVSYIYDMPTSEKAVFREMFFSGDQEKIRREGFSMLDMSNYLNAHGLEAKGYKLTSNDVEKYRLPFIALINSKGYNHFVVVKAMEGGRMLVGDPNSGNVILTREDFAKMWNGLALVIVNKASKGRSAFNNRKDWRFARARAPKDYAGPDPAELGSFSWQIASKRGDMLPATMVGAAGWGSGS